MIEQDGSERLFFADDELATAEFPIGEPELAGWWFAVRKRRHWTRYLGGVAPFLVSLFFFYAHLELLLPANF